jgi:hypothetical protein
VVSRALDGQAAAGLMVRAASVGGAEMTMLWITWPISAVVIVIIYMWVGKAATGNRGGDDYTGTVFGFLIDDRGRYSLTRLQLSLWTLVVLSLTAAVFAARAATRGIDPLTFSIPTQVLGLLGISVGSAAIATGVKAYKNRTRALFVAASPPGEASVTQMLMVEEGPQADKIVDVYKLQNFLVTIFLVCAYVVLAVHMFAGLGPAPAITSPANITTLPAFSGTFLTLLAISHAGYLGGKLPNRGQDPELDAPDMSLVRANARRIADRQAPQPLSRKAVAAAQVTKIQEEEIQARQGAVPDAGAAEAVAEGPPNGVEQVTLITPSAAAPEAGDVDESKEIVRNDTSR